MRSRSNSGVKLDSYVRMVQKRSSVTR
uniref:Uncharacterized protein n=1 Tax=Anguilla anguilla TaxID=7936 RepID=A0A0E9UFQ5_ANGAN